MTGLIWLKNANCFGARTWDQAIADCSGLASGSCGLTDGSIACDWRLPNINELNSLVDFRYHSPSLCNTAGTDHWTTGDPFTNVQSDWYWSSTAVAHNAAGAWAVTMGSSYVHDGTKTGYYYIWPVRGGH